LDARLTTLLCVKIIVAKSKDLKLVSNPSESSKEGRFANDADAACYHYYYYCHHNHHHHQTEEN
jgi:hypothetical protein